jgi:hypothetical protein
MSNSTKSQSIVRNICTRKSLIASSILAGFLTPVLSYNVAQAQERLPDLPPNVVESQPFPSPTQDGFVGQPVNQQIPSNYDFQAPAQNFQQNFPQNYQQPVQFSQRRQGYFVYVDGTDWQLRDIVSRLERGRRVPEANYRGRRVLQAGYFSREDNARRRREQLESAGIPRDRIIISLGENQIPGDGGGQDWPREPVNRGNTDFYYVIIPGNSQKELLRTQEIIRRNAGQSLNYIEVRIRNEPRGSHVAVGPFPQRLSAQQWNDYIRGTLNLGNARVYYGK